MAYATPAQLLQRYDARTVGDLASDTGIRIDPASLLSDANVQAALDDASGEIEAALLQGKRYSVADLAGLTGNTQKHLIRITCQIAFWMLWERRPYVEDQTRDDAESKAKKSLERLRRGEAVFDIEGPKDAGLPSVHEPTVSSYNRLSMIVDEGRRGYYPARRLPSGE